MSPKLLIAALCATLSMFTATSAVASSQRCDEKGEEHQHACAHAVTIYVGASAIGNLANGRVLDLLRQDFNIVSLGDGMPSPFFYGPVVVSAADLQDPAVNKLLTEVYDAGRTVALVAATTEQADRFARFFGTGDIANCTAHDDGSLIALYGLQKSVARRPPLHSSYCLKGIAALHRRGHHGKDNHDKGGDGALRKWLVARLALSPPEPPLGDNPDSNVNLQNLATQTHCSFLDADDPSNLDRQVQLDSYVLSVRSFDNDQDLYLVNNELQFQQGTDKTPVYIFGVTRFGSTGVPDLTARTSFTEPDSQNVTVSYTNSDSLTVTGTIGFDATNGFNASVSTSATVGTSTTKSEPPVVIENLSKLLPPYPYWQFTPTDTTTTGVLFSAEASWVWTVDQASYGADGGEGTTGRITFLTNIGVNGNGDFIGQPVCSSVPYPFSEWNVTAPQISSLSATSVPRGGGTFTINGTAMYPGLVVTVLLGGNALPVTNYVAKSDTALQVTVPSSAPIGTQQPVVVETTFNGQTLTSNSMPIDITR